MRSRSPDPSRACRGRQPSRSPPIPSTDTRSRRASRGARPRCNSRPATTRQRSGWSAPRQAKSPDRTPPTPTRDRRRASSRSRRRGECRRGSMRAPSPSRSWSGAPGDAFRDRRAEERSKPLRTRDPSQRRSRGGAGARNPSRANSGRCPSPSEAAHPEHRRRGEREHSRRSRRTYRPRSSPSPPPSRGGCRERACSRARR